MERNLIQEWEVTLGNSIYTVLAVTYYEARTKGAKLFQEEHNIEGYSIRELAKVAKVHKIGAHTFIHTIITRRKIFSLVEHYLEKIYNIQFRTECPIGDYHKADLLGSTDTTTILAEIKIRPLDALRLPVQLLAYKESLDLSPEEEIIIYSVLTNEVVNKLSERGLYYKNLVSLLKSLGIRLLIVDLQSKSIKEE